MVAMSSMDSLKVELKQWEHRFIADHDRIPTKDDIRGFPQVKRMYKQYAALKKAQQQRNDHVNPVKSELLKKVELGPTPQIYGKAISIFDMKVSPIKENRTLVQQTPDNMSTASTISQTASPTEDHTKRRLSFNMTPVSSPVKSTIIKEEVPKLPQATTNTTTGRYYGPNSPLRLEEENLQLSIRRTPLKQVVSSISSPMSSVFSPSPLIKRPLVKTLQELAREHEQIVEEFKTLKHEAVPNIFEQDETAPEEELQNVQLKAKRRRILRRLDANETNLSVPKDLGKELIKIKKQKLKEFLGEDAINDDDNETEEENKEATEEKVEKPTKKRSKKYNLVSNNFRRLKLPRKHGSKNNRWHGRRR